jgi:hypothetical protein
MSSARFHLYLGNPLPRLFEKQERQSSLFAIVRLVFLRAVAETVPLPVIPDTYPRAHKAARSNRESVAAL